MGRRKLRSAKNFPPETTELLKVLDELYDLTLRDVSELPRDLLDNFGRVRTLVEQARALEKPFDEVPHRSEEAMRELVDWGIRRGCFVHGIQIRHLGDEAKGDDYGVFCTDTLRDSDIFLSVPLDLMLTSDYALEKCKPLSNALRDDPICSRMSNICLSLLLLNEVALGEESFWHKYVCCLPGRYTTILYFTEDEMRLLNGSATLEEACNIYRSIARQYAHFKKKFLIDPTWRQLPAAKLFTYEAYRWACSSVMTRQNQVPSLSPGRMQAALIPLWDMCNHDMLRSGTDYDVGSHQLVSFATRSYAKDEQVCIFYGNRANGQFFVHNGFVPQMPNPWDSLPLRLSLSRSDQLFETKRRLCEHMKIPTSSVFDLKKNPEGNGVLVPKLLLHLVHVLQWKPDTKVSDEVKADDTESQTADAAKKDEEKNDVACNDGGDDSVDRDASSEAEGVRTKRAISYLQTRCQILLRTMPKSDEEIAGLLDDPNVSDETKLALRYRLSEKRMLELACKKLIFTM